jgi:hypothetical protein
MLIEILGRQEVAIERRVVRMDDRMTLMVNGAFR